MSGRELHAGSWGLTARKKGELEGRDNSKDQCGYLLLGCHWGKGRGGEGGEGGGRKELVPYILELYRFVPLDGAVFVPILYQMARGIGLKSLRSEEGESSVLQLLLGPRWRHDFRNKGLKLAN